MGVRINPVNQVNIKNVVIKDKTYYTQGKHKHIQFLFYDGENEKFTFICENYYKEDLDKFKTGDRVKICYYSKVFKTEDKYRSLNILERINYLK